MFYHQLQHQQEQEQEQEHQHQHQHQQHPRVLICFAFSAAGSGDRRPGWPGRPDGSLLLPAEQLSYAPLFLQLAVEFDGQKGVFFSLFGSFQVPLHSGFLVLLHPKPLFKAIAHAALGMHVSLLGGFHIPEKCLLVVL